MANAQCEEARARAQKTAWLEIERSSVAGTAAQLSLDQLVPGLPPVASPVSSPQNQPAPMASPVSPSESIEAATKTATNLSEEKKSPPKPRSEQSPVAHTKKPNAHQPEQYFWTGGLLCPTGAGVHTTADCLGLMIADPSNDNATICAMVIDQNQCSLVKRSVRRKVTLIRLIDHHAANGNNIPAMFAEVHAIGSSLPIYVAADALRPKPK